MMITSATKHTGGRRSMERPAASNRRCAESVAYCHSALAKFSHRTGLLSPNPLPRPHPITHLPIPMKNPDAGHPASFYFAPVSGRPAVPIMEFNFDRDNSRSEEHTSELQSPYDLVCRLLLEKKKYLQKTTFTSLQTTISDTDT